MIGKLSGGVWLWTFSPQ